MATERTAVLILRAWTEARPTGRLRVSLRHTSTAGAGIWRTAHLADAQATEHFVSAWLHEIETGTTGSHRPPTSDSGEAASNGAGSD
ncbi:MAG: hypothetical protein M0R73_07795 [Dehalococcoidia bacterium]|nr:hypothetical protein [Dehalococcoidia bacterium]